MAMMTVDLSRTLKYLKGSTRAMWPRNLGWLIWDHLPDGKEWMGMAMLIVAGLASVYAADKDETAK